MLTGSTIDSSVCPTCGAKKGGHHLGAQCRSCYFAAGFVNETICPICHNPVEIFAQCDRCGLLACNMCANPTPYKELIGGPLLDGCRAKVDVANRLIR